MAAITATDFRGRRGIRAITSLVAGLLVAIGLSVVAAPSAAAVPAGYRPNGCTLSPDRGLVPVPYDFKSACNDHDYCYDDLWYGGGENGRYACDIFFVNRMSAWCNSYYGAWYLAWQRGQCGLTAQVYYAAVRQFGGPYFNNPNKN